MRHEHRSLRIEPPRGESVLLHGVPVWGCPNCHQVQATDEARALVYAALGAAPAQPLPMKVHLWFLKSESPPTLTTEPPPL